MNDERTGHPVKGGDGMTVTRETQALLDLVEADREQQCGAILAEARVRAAAVLRQAHAEARTAMRNAFLEERLRREARVGAARANLQTRRRIADQQRAVALLAAGWNRVPGEMLRRWQAPDLRRTWVAAVIAGARKALPTAPWRIAHVPDWPAAEHAAIQREFAPAPAPECVFEPDPRIRAGLKVAAGGCAVDGTLDGLLADRAEIGSRLLHLLEKEAGR